MKIVRTYSFILLCSFFFVFSVYGASTDSKKPEYVQIDFRLNTKNSDKKNHFHWKNSETTYKDSFDAVSGASALHSTKEFRAISYDTTGKIQQAPKGLRSLFLFAVSPFSTLEKDHFSAQSESKKITIMFTHRGIGYKIETDEKGLLDVRTGFLIATDEETYVKDTSSDTAEKEYVGALKTTLSPTGILTIKGKLTCTDKKHDEPEAPDSPTEPEEAQTEWPQEAEQKQIEPS